MIRIGILGLTHDHIWDHGHLEHLRDSNGTELVAAADPHPALREQMAGRFGCDTYESYEQMLDRAQLDAVYVYSDNAAGAELTEMAAARGLHVMVEKPMAATLAGAEQMVRAAANNGVHLMVHWPIAFRAGLIQAMRLVEAGEIGQVWQVHYRSAHGGPKEFGCTPHFYGWLYDQQKNGGGALIDYCCYGAALARQFMGQPSRVTAVAGRFQKEYVAVEDNAVILMGYHHGLAISEASWTQIGNLTSYVPAIYGTEGTLVVHQDRLELATREEPNGRTLEVPQPPAELRNATAYFLSRINSDQPIEGLCSAQVSRDAQEILEAGLISAQTGQEVSLPLNSWLS